MSLIKDKQIGSIKSNKIVPRQVKGSGIVANLDTPYNVVIPIQITEDYAVLPVCVLKRQDSFSPWKQADTAFDFEVTYDSVRQMTVSLYFSGDYIINY